MSNPSRGGDVVLRALGLCLWAVAAGAVTRLVARPFHGGTTDALGFLWAVVAFLAGSAGSALVLFGRHLFDRVQVSERWRPRPGGSRSSPGAVG